MRHQACYDRMMLALSTKFPDVPMLTLWPGQTRRCSSGIRTDVRQNGRRRNTDEFAPRCVQHTLEGLDSNIPIVFPESVCEGFFVKKHLQNYVSSTSSHLHLCTSTFSQVDHHSHEESPKNHECPSPLSQGSVATERMVVGKRRFQGGAASLLTGPTRFVCFCLPAPT